MTPLKLYMEENCIVCEFTVFVDDRTDSGEKAREFIEKGLLRMERTYQTEEGEVDLRVKVTFVDEFSFGAVNTRIISLYPEERRWYKRGYNVSREYIGARHKGVFKFVRFVYRMPDVVINLRGRNLEDEGSMNFLCSVVQHEFGHVLGFRDQYRRKTFQKRRAHISDRDIMYRTGNRQEFMEYHIKRLKRCAQKGKPPFFMS